MPYATHGATIGSSYSQRSIIGAVIMGIVGNLRTMQLEELLQWLSQSRKTGTLEIKTHKVEKKITFRDGQIVATASTRPEEHLGHFLVSHGLISESALAKAIELQEMTGMLLGKILVTREILQENNLHQMLKLKSEETIYDIFSWDEGEFQFLDDVIPESAMVPMKLDVTAILMEGVQRVDEFRRIRQLIPSQDAIPVKIHDFELKGLDAGERQILELVDDERTVEEIRLQTHSSEFHVSRVLYHQWQAGRLKVIKPRWREHTGTFVAPSNGPLTGDALLDAGRRYMEVQDYEHALRHLRAARSLEPESPDIQEALTQGEKTIREAIESAGVTLAAVPQLAVSFDQLTSAKLSPQEGFMLTRLNGSYDIQSILKITPMPQLDALLVFWKLHKGGFIKLTAKKG